VELSSFLYKNQHTWSLGLKTLLTPIKIPRTSHDFQQLD